MWLFLCIVRPDFLLDQWIRICFHGYSSDSPSDCTKDASSPTNIPTTIGIPALPAFGSSISVSSAKARPLGPVAAGCFVYLCFDLQPSTIDVPLQICVG